MTEEPQVRCENCLYWDAHFDGQGYCRFEAPIVAVAADVLDDHETDTAAGIWPSTAADDWCGRFWRKGRIGRETLIQRRGMQSRSL